MRIITYLAKSLNIYEDKVVSKQIQQLTKHWFVDCHLLD